jgi:surfactin synthase thioesterase subunit
VTTADDATTPWIHRYHPASGSTRRLVCFPHAGGSASYFHPVSARFAPDVDVVSLQYPGRQDRRREPLIDTIEELADLVTAELLTLTAKPTVFFGHSMGAALAFETAWRLEREGVGVPRLLIASGRRGPTTFRDEAVHERDDNGVIEEIKLLNRTNSALLADDEILRMALPAIRGDYHAIETYRCAPGRTLSCPITAFTGDNDPRTTVDEAGAWQDGTTGAFQLKVFPGGRFFIGERPAEVNTEIAHQLESLSARI